MEDRQIIALFWNRDEQAISQSQKKYGRFCHTIAYRILSSYGDSEECVNDTWQKAWNAIPPEKPAVLQAFFGRITRNLALDRYAYKAAKKRNIHLEAAMEEYWECIPDGKPNLEDSLAMKDLLNRFLADLDKQTRIIFLRRYWYACSIGEIARSVGLMESNVSVILHRTRKKLKAYLEKEGMFI
ncbi:MAG: RNA polymerase sigma factor [Ruminococcaceae bacterium]|nr:RNA polymerase sigma factor [Oscillospiraceae bacterium]